MGAACKVGSGLIAMKGYTSCGINSVGGFVAAAFVSHVAEGHAVR